MQNEIIELSPTEHLNNIEAGDVNEKPGFNLAYKSSEALIYLYLLVLPFLFGGVHEKASSVFRALSCLVLIIIMLQDYVGLKSVLNYRTLTGKIFVLFSGCFIYLIVHSCIYYFVLEAEANHPILNDVGVLLRPSVSLYQIFDFYQYLSLYLICIYYFNYDQSRISEMLEKICKLIVISGFLVSLCALSHWFYDNGKLFWIFSAQHEAASTRARWPFVNPNHLAIFLSGAYFLTLGFIRKHIDEIKTLSSSSLHRGNLALADFIGKQSVQLQVRAILIYVAIFFSLSLAIIGSLSRNAGINILALTILYFMLTSRKKVSTSLVSQKIEKEYFDHDKQVRVKKTRRAGSRAGSQKLSSINIDSALPKIRFLLKAFVLAAIIWIIFFFLGEKGGELFNARVEYALLYTQEDMRWQMYQDSWPMLADYFYLGIGLGNWSSLYTAYTHVGLSGMEPAYLHSDLLQLLIEIGLPGFMLFAVLIGYWSYSLIDFKRCFALSPLRKSILYSVLSLVLCAAFEFPFRIPAICGLITILLALGACQKLKSDI